MNQSMKASCKVIAFVALFGQPIQVGCVRGVDLLQAGHQVFEFACLGCLAVNFLRSAVFLNNFKNPADGFIAGVG
jgi:hypothetical protein